MRFAFSRIVAAVALAAAFVAPSIASAQTDAQKAQLTTFVNTYYKAGAQGDAATFASVVTKNYTFTTVKGNVLNSSQTLAKAGVARGKAIAGGSNGAMGGAKITGVTMNGSTMTVEVAVQGSMNIAAGGEGGTMQVTRVATHTLTLVKGDDGKWRVSADKVNTQHTN